MTEDKLTSHFHWGIKLLYNVFIMVWFAVGTYPQLYSGDFAPHLHYARYFAETGHSPIQHIAFHRLVIIVKALLPTDIISEISYRLSRIVEDHGWEIAGLATAVLIYLGTAWILYFILKDSLKLDRTCFSEIKIWTLVVVCLLVMPINFFFLQERLTLGYYSANVLHNPTFILSRLFSLLLFYLCLVWTEKEISFKTGMLLSILSLLSTASKPNFMMALIPSLCIFFLIRNKSMRRENYKLLFFVGIPAFIVLLIQFLMRSGSAETSKFVFAPFMAVLTRVPNIPMVFLLLFLSLAFPITVFILNWKSIKQKAATQLLLITLAINYLLFILFAEVPKAGHLNFIWGMMTAVFLSFAYAIVVWVKQINIEEKPLRSIKSLLPLTFLLLHIASGFLYYFSVVLYPGPVW
ncbi:MAG: hypothetical protein GXY37_05150 [Chloroflexi bacterium]|nr:hypothetical protein [Chloroflexota bacterium]